MPEDSKQIMVSVIVPVYNVEQYVGKAIESIQKQTERNWELLLVDDGSPDQSGQICDEYAGKDDRITVIHKKNGGAPSARNAALEVAHGKYMYFMDADDWAEPEMLGDMLRTAEEYGSQLVIAGFYIDTYYKGEEKYVQEIMWEKVDTVAFATQREFRENAYQLFDRNMLYTPWNKLFLSQYLMDNNIRFPKTFWDDFPFNLSVIRDVEHVCVMPGLYYHFIRKRQDSETARYRRDMYSKREEEHGWLLDLFKYWDVNDGATMEFLARRYIERLIGCVENVTNKDCKLSHKEKKAEIRQMIGTSHAKEAAHVAKPRSTHMKLMLYPIKKNNVWLTYLEGRFVSFVKANNTLVFSELKAKR